MNKQLLFQQWINGTRINAMAHFKSASVYKKRDRRLGLLSALAGVIVTSSLFVTVSKDDNKTLLWITGIISIISTAVTTTYSFLKYAELSEKHYRAAIDYSHIRKKLELMQLKTDIANEDMETMNEEMSKLSENAPSIPQEIFDKSEAEVKSKNMSTLKTSVIQTVNESAS